MEHENPVPQTGVFSQSWKETHTSPHKPVHVGAHIHATHTHTHTHIHIHIHTDAAITTRVSQWTRVGQRKKLSTKSGSIKVRCLCRVDSWNLKFSSERSR